MTDNENQPTVHRIRAVLLMGPPGSGKGTQGRILGKVPGFSFVSMGDLLRSLDPSREPGRAIHAHLRAGELVPAKLVLSAWDQYLESRVEAGLQPREEQLVLDGFPRNIEQAELLEPRVEIQQVIHLACDDDEILMERIRQRNDGRTDDADANVIRHRFEVYRKQTVPLLDWYPRESITSVDGKRSPLGVLCQIVNALIS